MQIVAWPEEWISRFVTNNEALDATIACPGEKLHDTRIDVRVPHSRAVDIPLYLGPQVLLIDSTKVFANHKFRGRKFLRNVASLYSHPVKYTIIIDDRIVEIDSNAHPN